jgi:hypothetical protein
LPSAFAVRAKARRHNGQKFKRECDPTACWGPGSKGVGKNSLGPVRRGQQEILTKKELTIIRLITKFEFKNAINKNYFLLIALYGNRL